jgi:hypothetical protein
MSGVFFSILLQNVMTMKCLVSILFLLLSMAAELLYAQPPAVFSSNLPIVVIRTNGVPITDEPKITADMGLISNPGGARNSLNDPFNGYNGKIGIELRGQSSMSFPMKSYTVELRTPSGASQDLSVLGMEKESDWVLYATYLDKTLMRNFLAYTLSREMGNWAANCRFVELILNDQYQGVYVFMEKIKRNSARVNIPKMSASDISGDALTGGYIFSLDKEPNGWFSSYAPPFATNNTTRQFSYVYPKPGDIVQEQKDYIRAYVDSFETALRGPQFQDPVRGVRRFAHIPSFIDYFIINELSRNVDGYRLSSYFHKSRNSIDRRIHAGPVWDYDLSFRNADYCSGSDITGWAYRFNSVCPGDGAGLIPFWWERLMTDTAFLGELNCRWKMLRKTTLSIERINTLIDSVSNLLSESQQRHFTKWPILGIYVWPNPKPIASSYKEEIALLRSWITSRIGWIDDNLPRTGLCAEALPGFQGELSISVHPNPIRDGGQLVIDVRSLTRFEMLVTDMSGRILVSKNVEARVGRNVIPLNAGSWPAGAYTVTLLSEKGEPYTYRIVKAY